MPQKIEQYVKEEIFVIPVNPLSRLNSGRREQREGAEGRESTARRGVSSMVVLSK